MTVDVVLDVYLTLVFFADEEANASAEHPRYPFPHDRPRLSQMDAGCWGTRSLLTTLIEP